MEDRIKDAFACCEIEPYAPGKVLKNLSEKENKKELTNEELQQILAPTVIIQKVETKKGKKRFGISNKVVTSEEVISALKERKEAEEKKKEK